MRMLGGFHTNTHRQARAERICRTFQQDLRTKALGCYVFGNLQKVRDMTADWLHRYNHYRPREALRSSTASNYSQSLLVTY